MNMDASLLANTGAEQLPRFLSSLAIGLLIGLERERTPSAKAGLRTFALVALLGTLAAMLSEMIDLPWLLVAGWVVVGLMIIAAYFTNPPEEADPGTTTVAALLLCYGLGALNWFGQTTLAVMLAVGVTALLYFKPELRGMTQRLTRRDLVSILQFAVLTFVVLPILPDRSYGPYGALNPHQVWLMVVLISGISLAGYVALRFFRSRYGAVLLGLLGGLVSSTATSLVYARHSRDNANLVRLSVMVILIANMVVLVRIGVVTMVVAPPVLVHLLPILGTGLLFGLVVLVAGWRRQRAPMDLPVPETANPTEIHAALGFGLLYGVVLLASAWLTDIAGSKGTYAVALVSGLTDLDAITLSSLRLFELGQLTPAHVAGSVALAYFSNMLFKFGLVLFIGGKELARSAALGFVAICAGVALGWLLV
jgi:uncharacterized membrane protein (DUF4010 family)